MNDITVLPPQLAYLLQTDLTQLDITRLHEVSVEINYRHTLLTKARTKVETALAQRYGAQLQAALHATGRDFGTAHFTDGAVHIKAELPKRVQWDQQRLKDIAERIAAAGDRVEDYIDAKLSVSESRYTNWPPALQQQFSAARTVAPGKPTFTLSIEED